MFWVLVLVLFLGAASIFAGLGFGMERGPHFGVRICLVSLVPPSLVLLAGASVGLNVMSEHEAVAMVVLLLIGCLPALMLVPALLYKRSDSSSGDSDDDGGHGPRRPPSAPDPPSGGPPLPDADPARRRVRDHDRPDLRVAQPRRTVREPARSPAPKSPCD